MSERSASLSPRSHAQPSESPRDAAGAIRVRRAIEFLIFRQVNTIDSGVTFYYHERVPRPPLDVSDEV
jgi:hypothetical protein